MATSSVVYNASTDYHPPVTPALLYARTKSPVDAFRKHDKNGSGRVGIEEMRAAFAALGTKLTLNEAKAMVARQMGDKGAPLKDMQFDYEAFISSMGVEKAREDARHERLATEADHPSIDVHNPVPQPSAAAAILERLRRERGTHGGEGYMVSLLDEQPKQKPLGDATYAKSELDKLGGLAHYLSEDNVERVPPGYLPRMPGEPFARKAVDDRIFTKGDFTTTGLGQWIAAEEQVPEGYHALPGQQAHRKPTDTAMFQGALDKSGGISGYIADTKTDADLAPEGYTVVFPGQLPRRLGSDPIHATGELTARGGLLNYLADTVTDSQAQEGYLPRMPGQAFAKQKQSNKLHQQGEFTSTGIGKFLLEGVEAPAGYHTGITSLSPRKVTTDDREALFLHGGFASNAGERTTDSSGAVKGSAGPGRSGYMAAVDDDDVPVLPEDVRIEGTDAYVSSEKSTAGGKAHFEGLSGKSGEVDDAGGVSRYVSRLPSSTPAPARPTEYPERRVGTISKAGGLGSYVADASAFIAREGEGYVAPMPGQAYAKAKVDSTILTGPKGQVESSGNLFTFMAEGAEVFVPEGYLAPLRPGESPRKKPEQDKSMIGQLDAVGGLGGFYSTSEEGGAHGALARLPGQEFARQVNFDAERAATAGRIEGAGGIGRFMMSVPVPPEGYVTDISGENMRQIPNNAGHQGTLEKHGGIGGYMDDKAGLQSDIEGYQGFAWEAKRKALVDPLHHYGTIAAEGVAAFSLGEGKVSDKDVAVSTHVRNEKMKSGKIAGQGNTALALPEYNRTDRHLKGGRVAELTKEAEVPRLREVSIKAGHRADEATQMPSVRADERDISLVQARAEKEAFRAARTAEAQAQAEAEAKSGMAAAAALAPSKGAAAQLQGSGSRPGTATPTLSEPVAPATPVQPASAVRSPGGSYAGRHAKNNGVGAGTGSPKGMTSAAASAGPAVQVDVRRLARVRKAIRDMLPKKDVAAVTLLRQKLHKEDGDGDGVVSDIELLRGLTGLTPGLAPSDVGFLIKYFKDKFRASTEKLTPEGIKEADTTGGLAAGITVAAVSEWVTRQPGGHESRYNNKDGQQNGSEEGEGAAGPTVAGDRITWTSRAHKFNQFRAAWEEKHGGAAIKELAHDLALPVDGPTWARADPQPFKVLHLAGGAPPASPAHKA